MKKIFIIFPFLLINFLYSHSFNNGIWDLSIKIYSEMKKNSKKKIAINLIEVNKNLKELSYFILDELITSLSKNNDIIVVERGQLSKVIDELKLNLSGLLDEKDYKEFGKILNIDVICFGSISQLGNSIKLNFRLIDTETAKIIGAVSTEISDPKLKNYLQDFDNNKYLVDFDLHTLGNIPLTKILKNSKISYDFYIYANGILNSFKISLFNFMSIGISENINNLIGYKLPEFFIPNLHFKLNIIDNINSFSWSIGYDNFNIYENYNLSNNLPIILQGIYTVFGWNFNFITVNNQFNLGYKFPVLPLDKSNITNSTIYLSFLLGLTDNLYFGLNIDNFYINFTRFEFITPSIILLWLPYYNFSISLIFNYNFQNFYLDKILKLEYQFVY